MHFCSQCQNMYYISIDPNDSNKLVYYCRNCGNKDSTLSIENVTVSKVQLKKSEQEETNQRFSYKFMCFYFCSLYLRLKDLYDPDHNNA